MVSCNFLVWQGTQQCIIYIDDSRPVGNMLCNQTLIASITAYSKVTQERHGMAMEASQHSPWLLQLRLALDSMHDIVDPAAWIIPGAVPPFLHERSITAGQCMYRDAHSTRMCTDKVAKAA
jgi:hypothetical protein